MMTPTEKDCDQCPECDHCPAHEKPTAIPPPELLGIPGVPGMTPRGYRFLLWMAALPGIHAFIHFICHMLGVACPM